MTISPLYLPLHQGAVTAGARNARPPADRLLKSGGHVS